MGQDVAKDRNLDIGEGREDPRDPLDTSEGQGWASAYRAAEVNLLGSVHIEYLRPVPIRGNKHNFSQAVALRARLCPRQDTQNILQLFALGINNMAQGKLFHSDGSDDHCQGFFPSPAKRPRHIICPGQASGSGVTGRFQPHKIERRQGVPCHTTPSRT